MKCIIRFTIALLAYCTTGLYAQTVPQGINYQTIVRGSNNDPLPGALVTLQFQIKDGIGSLIYSEEQTKNTNDNGLVNMIIGQGTPQFGEFQIIDWSIGPRTLTVYVKNPAGSFDPLSTMQLMSVPYAFYTARSKDASTAQTLADLGAQVGQVLQWNGSAWVPATINAGTVNIVQGNGIGVSVNGSNNFTISNTGDTDAANDLTNTSTASGDVIGSFSNLQIAEGAVGTNELANGAVTAAKLNNMGATTGQVMQWNGNAWVPENISGTGFEACGKAIPDRVGIGKCPNPNNQVRLDVGYDANNQNKIGVNVDVSGTGLNRGMLVSVEKGTTANDGIIALAFDGANNNVGMKIVSGSDEIPTITTNQNYGMFIDLRSMQNEPSRAAIKPSTDVGLYVTTENIGDDYAAYFDGDIGIPHELEFIDPSNGNQWAMYIEKANEVGCTGLQSSNDDLLLSYNGNLRLLIRAADGAECVGSDRRLKENIVGLNGVLASVCQLNPVRYNLKADEDKNQTFGFIAQEIAPLFPELVYQSANKDIQDLLTLNYTGFSVLAIKAIQEQQQIIEAQHSRMEGQEARIITLEKEMAEIKALLLSNLTAKSSEK